MQLISTQLLLLQMGKSKNGTCQKQDIITVPDGKYLKINYVE